MEVKNFKKNDNSFVCINCGKSVGKLGYTSRNHCPHCLHSLHVDIMPGDRENSCKGLLIPSYIESNSKKGYIINFTCAKCGKKVRNVSAKDDSLKAILNVMKQQK